MNFKNAVIDYRLLKNKLYPDKAALKLVGDRYRLPSIARNCLLRGVATEAAARIRRSKISGEAAAGENDLGIDWFNVLITLESYLKGGVLFLADDGLLRDSAAVHGSYRPGPMTGRAIALIIDSLDRLAPRRIDIFIDSPISRSKQMRDELEERLLAGNHPFVFTLTLAASADYALKSYLGLVASSDSVIIDACRAVIDLPRLILARAFSFKPVSIDELDV